MSSSLVRTVYDCDVSPLIPPNVSRSVVQLLYWVKQHYDEQRERGVPICNVIILFALTVHGTLNRISLVVQYEDDGLDSDTDHDR